MLKVFENNPKVLTDETGKEISVRLKKQHKSSRIKRKKILIRHAKSNSEVPTYQKKKHGGYVEDKEKNEKN